MGLNIGHDPADPDRFFGGAIDEVDIFGRALDPTEIQAIFNAGRAGKCRSSSTAAIQIKPPSAAPVSINLSASGVIPVAILSSHTFDARQVDPASVTLAGARVGLIGRSGRYSCSAQDVNGDGLQDLMCQVSTAQFLIQPGDSTVVLEGQTFAGAAVRGQEAIRVVPQ